MEKLRLGIIGFGNMGSSHVKNIIEGNCENVTVAAVCDIKEERRAASKELYPDIPVFENAEDLYKSGLCEAVIIAVPHYDHPSLAIKAFDCGLHVITEKPAGVYTKQVLEMNEAAEKSGKVFGIMYNQRTNPVYAKVRELIQSSELGAIKRVQWTITNWYRSQAYHDSAAWRSTWATEGGGALINQNPHQLDLWQWMFGMPSKIMAFMSFGKYHSIEVEDDVTAYMEYDSGMTGVYITSTGEAPGTNRLEIACDRGVVIVENNKIHFRRNVISERAFEKANTSPFGCPEVWDCEIPVKNESRIQHMIILDDFAKAVKEGTPMLAPGAEGINGLTISNAMHYSAFTGKWADLKSFPHDEFYSLLEEKIKASKAKTNVNEITADTTGTY